MISPVNKGASRVVTGLTLAAVSTLLVLLLGGLPIYFLLGINMVSGIIYLVIILGTPIISFITWLKKMEAKCPYCNEIIQFSDSATGVTCKACKQRTVIKGSRLLKVT